MKRLHLLLIGGVLLLAAIVPAFAADPLGLWFTSERGSQVRITDCGGALCGSIIWLREPNDPATGRPKTDKNNVDPSMQNRPLVGVQIMLGMRPNGPSHSEWSGDVYNASDGKTYPGYFTITGDDTAQIKGCVAGMGWLCIKSQTWTRAQVPLEEQLTSGGGGLILVPLQKVAGTFTVPVLINNAIKLNFVVDSGASVVSIPADVVTTLFRTGTLQKSDFIRAQTLTLADGSTIPSTAFRIRSLRVNNIEIENVEAGTAPADGDLLLGQSFLSRFKSWSIDNARQALVLTQ
jgi:uncharacterized protein (DUF2147 family)/predicted aspartyl protease